MKFSEFDEKPRTIAILPGDGIGPEIVAEAVKVLQKIDQTYYPGQIILKECLVGGAAYDATGDCLPADTLKTCRTADAVLLGAVGGPQYDALPPAQRPEKRALLTLRKELGLFANLRPAKVWPQLHAASPLKAEILAHGIDLLVVRELTGGIYFGDHQLAQDGSHACDLMPYSKDEIERIAVTAFQNARRRNHHVTCVDKANVLATSRLWREVVRRVHEKEFTDCTLDFMYVDNAAMQLVRNPAFFDVLLTENMFGDILSDEASQITGSIGMLPSASLRADGFGLYEPIHGSAPDIAGQNKANPLATILSVALMLRTSLEFPHAAHTLEGAVAHVLSQGLGTGDLFPDHPLTTSELGTAVCNAIH